MNRKKSCGLDIIRIAASLLVFIPHLIINLSNNINYTNSAYIIATIGVELFFCLSGYLICKQGIYILRSNKNLIKNTFIFIKRRILRTWPAYFFTLVSYIIFYRYYDNEVLLYLLFLQNLFYPMISDTFFSVSWSICVEELFYIIFPFLLCFTALLFRKKNKNPKLYVIFTCTIIILIIFFTRNNIVYTDWGSEVRRVSFFRLDAIAFGGIGYFFFERYFNYKYLKVIVIFFLICFLIILNHYLFLYLETNDFKYSILSNNLIFYIIYFFCISLIFLSDKIINITNLIAKNIISEIANWAYPLYLMHTLVIDLIKNFYINNLFLNVFSIIFLNLLLAYTIRNFIELPFLKKRPNYLV